MKKICIS